MRDGRSGITAKSQPTEAAPLAAAQGITKVLPCGGEFFDVDNRPAFLLLPTAESCLPARPWLWYAPTFPVHPDHHHLWMFRQFLEKGIAIAGVDVGESFGNPDGRRVFTTLYETLSTGYGMSERACLMPQSRGGLMLYNWAAENPRRVACIAGIYTVCDLRSWPGIAAASKAYGLDEAAMTATLGEHNPVDRLKPLAEAGVPILHIHGNSDQLIPIEKHSGELARRYAALGGSMRLIVVPGKGHEETPEFFECQELVDFVVTQALARSEASPGT